MKAQLLALIREDPDFRAAVLEAVDPIRLKADVVEAVREDARASPLTATPGPVFTGPAWLATKAAQHGPHTRGRFGGPK